MEGWHMAHAAGIKQQLHILITAILAALILTLCPGQVRTQTKASPKASPENGAGAYATGKYRNLFLEAGYSPKEISAKISRAYEQLFHGDPETQLLYFPSGRNENGPLAYIPDIQHNDVRSEGMSYGMMITVQLNKKAEFDALWNRSVTHMYQKDPAHPSYGFFSWNLSYDGTVRDELPAPDGEEYYVMALYFAANRWGNGEGIYNYKAYADRILGDMVHRKPITGKVRQYGGVRDHTVGKEVNEEYGMILFSPDERNSFSDVSYHLPAFYELWARSGDRNKTGRSGPERPKSAVTISSRQRIPKQVLHLTWRNLMARPEVSRERAPENFAKTPGGWP
jgi:oligosaccharide reducing-end xylanase